MLKTAQHSKKANPRGVRSPWLHDYHHRTNLHMSYIYRRVTQGLLTVLCALALTGAAVTTATARQDDASGRSWSTALWKSALEADAARFELMRSKFDGMPSDAFDEEYLEHFRLFDQRSRENEEKALHAREEARAEALEELREHKAEGDLGEALLAAVKVQTFSDDFDKALRDPEIREIVEWAEREIPRIEADNDWLEAQELVYRMRTLYDDTDQLSDYARYDDDLTEVNRRVSLLAKYAPRHLHAYRTKRAEELGEDPPPPFNEFRADDWEERLEGISARMLKTSLKTAAVEHIEDERWRPLLEGGLEALRIFATTPALSETFTSLDDEARRKEWVAFLDSEVADLAKMKDDDMTSWTLSRMIDRILRKNEETVQLPPELLYREFGDGAMFHLDKFSEIMWPDKLRRFEQATQGNFVGVGIIIRETETNEIMVVNPLEGSPAYYAGVKPNDIIAEVNGESTVGWSTNDAVDHITGEPNTTVTLGLQREGEEDLVPVTITRKLIKLRSVFGWWKERLSPGGEPEWDWFIDPKTRIAYIRLTQFTEDSYNDLLMAWREIEDSGGANGLILDLRYNPGGLLVSAVQISNLFVDEGIILSAEDKYGREAFPPQRANRNRAKLAGLPTVVLVNKGSASASEIVAGCLQAHGSAVIVGERSYGKGSVQTVHRTASNAQLKLTTQYYRLPPNKRKGEVKGRIVHKRPNSSEWGVDPDIVVPMTPSQIEDSYFLRQEADIIPEDEAGRPDPESEERPDINGLITEGLDPQLESALLILQARVLGELDGTRKHAAAR